MTKGDSYFRQVAATVLQWYVEMEDGRIGDRFSPGILDFRIDVERTFKLLPAGHEAFLLAVHRDGETKPEAELEPIEVLAGQLFDSRGLFDIRGYIR